MKIENLKLKILSQDGITLVELILYIAIVSLMLTALIPMAWNIIGAGTRSTVQQETYSNARLISERIKYEIRNASGINSVSSTSISLQNPTAALNPTVIAYSAGNVTIQQGAGTATRLNSVKSTISSFTFTNYTSGTNSTKHIGVVFTLNSNFNSTRREFQESITIETSAEVRSN